MYVITFYSFKGGVGRSMALANTAFELAQTGRKVLIVDFDLEAPGLLDYDISKPEVTPDGIVEYVTNYIETGKVPDVKKYIFESTNFPEKNGKIYVMPAGRLDETYQERFGKINWSEFYSERDGYVVMEDLRAQWQEQFNFDYVLIDSRTGYTDIAGICTRQLPDAVCLVFTPNSQNLYGIQRVYKDILAQRNISQLRHPKIHFVASNVPSLGDDNYKVDLVLQYYRESLDSCELSGTIYHHDSFALLEQEVFTHKYPLSTLASEYRNLVRNVTKYNLNDRLAAIQFLQEVISNLNINSTNSIESTSDLDERVNQILTNFPNETEIILACARIKRLVGDVEQHRELLEIAIERGSRLPRVFLELAAYQERENNGDDAWDNVLRSLGVSAVMSVSDLTMAVRLGIRLFDDSLDIDTYAKSKSVLNMSLDELLVVCTTIDDNITSARFISRLLGEAILREDSSKLKEEAWHKLSTSLIALGNIDQAMEILKPLQRSGNYKLAHTFNLAMVCFWSRDYVEKDFALSLFEVAQKLLETEEDLSPNKVQCMAFIYWALGNSEKAQEKILELKNMIGDSSSVRFFSCWRYYYSTRRQAAEDIAEMSLLFSGKDMLPRFLRGTNTDLLYSDLT